MSTVRFFIKSNSNPSSIYVRLRDGRYIDAAASTGLMINSESWNPEKGCVRLRAEFRDKGNLQNKLSELSQLLHNARNDAALENHRISREWLETIIANWKGLNPGRNADLLIDKIDMYRENLEFRIRDGKIGATKGSMRNYKTTIQRIRKFELQKKRRLKLTDLDFVFHAEYLKYATAVLRLAPNSIKKDIQHIKTVCLDARDNGYKVHENVLSRNFNAPTEKTIFTTLNETELGELAEFVGPDYLMNARDWLIIGCWTGCRVGDLMRLKNNNVINHASGNRMIQYTQSKTGKTVNVPLHPDVVEILERLGGFPRAISDQKFNAYIKEVSKRVGLTQKIYGTRQNPKSHFKEAGYFEKWQLIKSHTCRRSFATNHYAKLSNKLIMAVTGHTSEQMLLKYIGEVESDHIAEFANLWNSNPKKEVQKILKIVSQ